MKKQYDIIPIIKIMREKGYTYRKIAKLLNKDVKSIWRWHHYPLVDKSVGNVGNV